MSYKSILVQQPIMSNMNIAIKLQNQWSLARGMHEKKVVIKNYLTTTIFLM